MIYQLKIELFNQDLPIQRIIEVDASVSLKQLHYTIQTAFDWSALMPHLFIVHQGDQTQAFGDHKYLRHSFLEFYRRWTIKDEQKYNISSCLHSVGDAIIYEYFQNYRTTRYHSIELLAIKEAEEGQIYPYCTQATHLAPREPYRTRFSRMNLDLDSLNVHSLKSMVNQFLMQDEAVLSQPLIHTEEYYQQELFHHSLKFLIKKPWLALAEDQMFAVVEYISQTQLFCSVNGQDGREAGLSVFVGKDSFIELNHVADHYTPDQDPQEILDKFYNFYGLGMLFKYKDQIPDAYLDPYADYDSLWPSHSVSETADLFPLFFAYQSQKQAANTLTIEEMRWLILCLKQAIAVADLAKQGLKVPSIKYSDILLERSFSFRFQQFINNEIRLIKK